MKVHKSFVVFSVLLSLLFFSTSRVDAGFAVRLEKEFPQSSVTGVNPITVSMFHSKTALSPVATQNFNVGALMISTLETLNGAPMYRVRMDFTETDALTAGMDLYWEFSLGGSIMGKREKVPQSAWALFAAEAALADDADTVDGSHAADFAAATHGHTGGDIVGGAGSGLDADTVDGQHAAAFAGAGHNHDATYVNEGQASSVTAGMIGAGAVSNSHVNAAAAIAYSKLNHPGTDHDYSGQFYSQAEVDALLLALEQTIQAQQVILRRAWLTLGTPQLIETTNLGYARFPQVAVDALGNAIAVWQQNNGSRDYIWANRYTAGAGWGTAELVESNEASDALSPDVGVDSAGNAVAVWRQGDGFRNNIWANTYTVGSGWGTAALIETNDTGTAGAPKVAVHSSGDAIAVWGQSDGAVDSIWANVYTAGSGWGTPVLIETDDTDSASSPRVAFDATGVAFAVWDQSTGTMDNGWANMYTAGSGWGSPVLIETVDTGDAREMKVGADTSGNAVAVWRQRDGTYFNAWSNTYTAGSGWGTAALLETDNAGHVFDVQVAVEPGGNAVAVWVQSDGTRNNVWANTYTAGSGWAAPALIETDNAGSAFEPQVAIEPSGDAVAVWKQSDGTRDNIWANTYTPGSGWGVATLIETDNAGAAQGPQVAIDSFSKAIAVWFQSDGTRDNIWSNIF